MQLLIYPVTIPLALLFTELIFAILLFKSSRKGIQKMPSSLDEASTYQLELDQYIKKSKNGIELGLLYERYIGYRLETDEYNVTFHGAINGYADLGIDLIAHQGNKTLIIQTKYWAKHKTIPEKHVLHLYASAAYYKKKTNYENVKPVLFSSTEFSDKAKDVASTLGVELRVVAYDRNYPMVKCEINEYGERLFHLPTDESYDHVKIEDHKNEFYVNTVAEAIARGFRRVQKSRKSKYAV